MYEYRAEVIDVIDGDTIRVRVDLGFSTFLVATLRLVGIDTPERHTNEGQRAWEYLKDLLAAGRVTVQTMRTEKYGRYLANVRDPAGRSVNELLVEAGHAKPYHGGKRE